MKKDIIVPLTDTPLTLLSGITFARVPYWFPFYDYKDLKMDLVLPFRLGGGEKGRFSVDLRRGLDDDGTQCASSLAYEFCTKRLCDCQCGISSVTVRTFLLSWRM